MAEGKDISTMVVGGRVGAIVPQNIAEVFDLAEAICNARMNPKGLDNAQQVTVAIMMGLEVGMTPMAALASIAVINGRPCLFGDGLLGVVRASGLMEDFNETFDEKTMTATCWAKRKGQKTPIEKSFSKDDAIAAGLWLLGTDPTEKQMKKPWFKYPERMLAHRARGWCLRDGFADALRGLQSREELEDMIDVTPSISESLSGSKEGGGFDADHVDEEIGKLETVGVEEDEVETEAEEADLIVMKHSNLAPQPPDAPLEADTEAAQEPEATPEADTPTLKVPLTVETALELAREIHGDLKIRTTTKGVQNRMANLFEARIDSITNAEDAADLTAIAVAHEARVMDTLSTDDCNAEVKRLGEAIKAREEV